MQKNLTIETSKPQSVCVIGAGPAGLVVAQKFLQKGEQFNVTILEKLSDVGGAWIYSDNTGNDEYGLPVHSSIYQNLRTNLPTSLMEFDDFPHNHNPTGFVTHQEILEYLQRYANHFNIPKYTKFLHLVTKIYRHLDTWKVIYRNLETNETFTQSFDVICVCQGRFSDPSLPKDIPGLDDFKGTVLHSHVYRRADIFTGKRVSILGGGPSGVDISIEVAKYAAVTFLCYTVGSQRKYLPVDDKIIQPGAVFKSIGVDWIELTNGTVLQSIDVIIFCTGYSINLDIFDKSCEISGGEGHIDELFLHMININHPTMAFFGLIEKIPPFNFSCQMATYYVRLLMGEVKLPSKEEMIADLEADREERRSMNIKLKYSHRMFADQMWRYDRKISQLGGIKMLSSLTKLLYDECLNLRLTQVNYRDYQFLLNPDGKTFSREKRMNPLTITDL